MNKFFLWLTIMMTANGVMAQTASGLERTRIEAKREANAVVLACKKLFKTEKKVLDCVEEGFLKIMQSGQGKQNV